MARDHLRVAHARENRLRLEHATAVRQQLTQEEQRETASKQRIADGLQAQQDQAADLRALRQELKTTAQRLIAADQDVRTDAHNVLQLLNQQILETQERLARQQLTADAQQDQRSADLQQQLATMQQQLLDAVTQLLRPKKVTIQRNVAGKVIGAKVG